MTNCDQLLEIYFKRSKGYQSFLRVKKDILTFENLIGVEIENWTVAEIFASWRYLESLPRQRLTHGGLQKKLDDIQKVFESFNLPQFQDHSRALKIMRNGYINSRIDNEQTPWTKKNANRPPYSVWKTVALAMEERIVLNCFTNATKKLRLHQALLALIWCRSCGARLREIMRIKCSDISVRSMGEGQPPYLNLNIRRSKSNQRAKKQLNYKLVENTLEPVLCPMRALKLYLRAYPMIKSEGDFIFISSLDHREHAIDGKLMTDAWNNICDELLLEPHHYPQAHSGHDCFIILAMAQKRPKEEILDATQWKSLEVLPHYVQGPSVNGINHSLATTKVEDLDNLMQVLVEYNIQTNN